MPPTWPQHTMGPMQGHPQAWAQRADGSLGGFSYSLLLLGRVDPSDGDEAGGSSSVTAFRALQRLGKTASPYRMAPSRGPGRALPACTGRNDSPRSYPNLCERKCVGLLLLPACDTAQVSSPGALALAESGKWKFSWIGQQGV